MFEHLGLTFTRTHEIAYSLDCPPPYYSNLVTYSPEWQPDDTFDQIGRRARKEGWLAWGIKDSHGSLDLREHGLARLFEAQWLWRDAGRRDRRDRPTTRFERITDLGGLDAWRRAWDADERVGKAVFRSSLLDDDRVCFVGGWDGDTLGVGCLLNRTGPVWGVSNTFGTADDVSCWSALVAFIDAWTNGTALVGYDRGDALPPMEAVGFEPVGDLAVWATPAGDERATRAAP